MASPKFTIKPYQEEQLDAVRKLIDADLSEPYSVYTYRYFISNWPYLCFLAFDTAENVVGTIVCKLEPHNGVMRGYIAMLAVVSNFRHLGIGSELVKTAIRAMSERDCAEVVLETEIANVKAMSLYLKLGFVKAKRMMRYYFNGNDAFRLKLWLK